MRVSAEANRVNQAQSQLAVMVLEFQQEHDLSDIEVLQALHEIAQSKLKYMLRYERHGDYETPAMQPVERECGSRGPRVGEDVAYCRLRKDHPKSEKHRNFLSDGFGSVIEW